MVVEQNHSYSSVIGNSTMPYLNSLASKYGLATQYYANTHSAIGNYFEMTTGSVLTNDDTLTPTTSPVSADNIALQLMVAGKTWKSYAEGLPYAGYTGGNTGNYAVRNNPFAYFTDVQNSSAQKMNLVPFSQFATDLANNQLPDFSFIVPNLLNDGHNGALQQGDGWLKQNIAPLLADKAFQKDGLLIITFDESDSTDTAHGGGRVATLVIGPAVKQGYKSTAFYQHPSLLHTVLAALGATSFPGAAASAPVMSEFFISPVVAQIQSPAATTVGTVTITSPANGATVSSPVQFVASGKASAGKFTKSMQIFVDNVSVYSVKASTLNKSLSLASGAHNVVIKAWDNTGVSYQASRSITVGSSIVGTVTITSPASGATVSSPVQFVASSQVGFGRTIAVMRIYVDSVSVYSVNASSLNTSLALASGAHSVVIQAWDNLGAVYKSSRNITVASTRGALSVNPPSLSFGPVNVGSSGSQAVTVTASTAPVTISQASATSGFAASGLTLPLTIAAAQSASFSVTFAPTVSGSVSGSLTLTSNASNPTTTVALGGTGTVPTVAHSVALSWSESAPTGVSGYNVYRGTQSGGPYTIITTSPDSGMTYTDSSVSAGATYYYVVTAMNTTGVESGYSASATATVPTP
jgi:phosphatidylinositol-3-phosphatase